MNCPICKGKGTLPMPKNYPPIKAKKAMAKMLHSGGFSYRQIMGFFNLKSPRSISDYLGKNN